MNFLTRRLLGRLGPAGRVADLAIVGGAALKFAQRKGLVSDQTAQKLGASDSSGGSNVSIGEILLLLMALWRLVKHFSSKDDSFLIEVVD